MKWIIRIAIFLVLAIILHAIIRSITESWQLIANVCKSKSVAEIKKVDECVEVSEDWKAFESRIVNQMKKERIKHNDRTREIRG